MQIFNLICVFVISLRIRNLLMILFYGITLIMIFPLKKNQRTVHDKLQLILEILNGPQST